jgi:hypothetical protein
METNKKFYKSLSVYISEDMHGSLHYSPSTSTESFTSTGWEQALVPVFQLGLYIWN